MSAVSMHRLRVAAVPPPPSRSDLERSGRYRAVTIEGRASPRHPSDAALRVHTPLGRR